MLLKKKTYELKNKSAVLDFSKAGIIIGFIFYILVFYGINKSYAGSSGIILHLEIITVFLFFYIYF